MDGVVLAERRRPSSCQSSFNFLSATTTSTCGDVAAVEQRRTWTGQATADVTPPTDVPAGETTHVEDAVLDLSTTADRRLASPPPARTADSTPVPVPPAGWDVYRRYVDDLRRLDELIQQRTYERNVLSWRREQTKRSLERLLQHPLTTVSHAVAPAELHLHSHTVRCGAVRCDTARRRTHTGYVAVCVELDFGAVRRHKRRK